MRWKPLIIALLILVSGILYYQLTGNTVYETIQINVTRVIDGDTIVLENNEHVRLLGINTPEKQQPMHDEAMNNLRELIDGKKIELLITERDKYDRLLGYIFYNNELINKKQLESGFASLYYYGTDKYYNEMKKAEETARNNALGIWKKSTNFGCLKILKLKYKESERCTNQEQIIIDNLCSAMNIIIKDDANHISEVNINPGIYSQNFSCVWNDDGDSLFIRDQEGLLFFQRY